MYLTKKYIDVGQENRVINVEINNGGSMVKLEILSEKPLDNSSTREVSNNWDIIDKENIITLD